MIIYDLKCEKNHTFEGWFNDSNSFDQQRKQKLVTCPVCGSAKIEMALSTVTTISGRDDRKPKDAGATELSPMMALKMFHDFIDREFDDVGDKFAEVALNIHKGLDKKRNIKGTTTKKEEETLQEEGVEFIKVPVPKFDS